MSGHIRLPNITGKTAEEQTQQIRSYLTQLVGELNWAFGNIGSTGVAGSQNTSSDKGGSVDKIQQKVEDVLMAFNNMKGLIAKSADIVDAVYDEVSTKLDGLYVPQSEYGSFVEKTSAITTQNSTNTTTNYENLQILWQKYKVIEDLLDITVETLIKMQAHIKSGILYYDESGIPIYGIEIGQMNTVNGEEVFNKFAQFTSDRLSFYDINGNEVAYISDYKLYIADADISGSIKVGGYVETASADGGTITKWIGG